MKLTASQIRCLIALQVLSREGERVASKDVAQLLGITRPSVHKLLDILCREALTEKAPYGSVHLTPDGRALAAALERRQTRLMELFTRTFRLSGEESRRAATQLMSALREDSLHRLETHATGAE